MTTVIVDLNGGGRGKSALARSIQFGMGGGYPPMPTPIDARSWPAGDTSRDGLAPFSWNSTTAPDLNPDE